MFHFGLEEEMAVEATAVLKFQAMEDKPGSIFRDQILMEQHIHKKYTH